MDAIVLTCNQYAKIQLFADSLCFKTANEPSKKEDQNVGKSPF